MSEQKANQDYRYPMAETFLYAPMTFGSFLSSDRIPIFWGPGQYLQSYPQYSPPDQERWRLYEHLNIPVVTRFMYGNENETDDEFYNDDEDTGGGTPGDFECPGWQYEVTPCWLLTVKPSAFRIPGDPYSGVDSQYLVVENPDPIGGDGSTSVYIYAPYGGAVITFDPAYKGETGAVVKVYNVSDNSLVSATSAKDCPLLHAQPFRIIQWFNICIGGGTPEGGVRNAGSYGLYAMATGADNTQPPRCSYRGLEYVGSGPGTADPARYCPSSVIETGEADFSEVPLDAQNWYGCGDPGGQRSPPPPPDPFPYVPPTPP